MSIIVNDLTVTYVNKHKQEVVALDNLNCQFAMGKINVIVGYSGCGKTTLLKCIAGLLDYDGTITVNGVDYDTLEIKDRNLAMVSQQYILYPNMTIFDNIAFPLKIAGADRKEITERVTSIADKLGLQYCLTRKPKHLSGGQQQRVALARALVKHPDICLFDEPLSNVDAQQRIELRQMIKQAIKSLNTTAIYVTHDITEAFALADELFVIYNGKLEISGTPMEVYRSGNEVVKSLMGEHVLDATVFN